MLILGIIVMICSSLASNMGLSDAIASVVSKIIRCPRCSSFWITLILVTALSGQIIKAAVIAVTVSYLSCWAGLIITVMSYKYDELWQRLNRRKRRR